MKIKAKQAFLSYDGAKPIIARRGSIHDVSEQTAKGLVYDGLAEYVILKMYPITLLTFQALKRL